MTKKIVKRTDANNEILYFYTHSDAVDVGEGNNTTSLTAALNNKANASDVQALSDDALRKSPQSLSSQEKEQVHNNIGTESFVDDRAVRYDDAQVLGSEEKTQALTNLGLNGVDDEPTPNSDNLVKSGGVKSAIDEIQTEIDGSEKIVVNESISVSTSQYTNFYFSNGAIPVGAVITSTNAGTTTAAYLLRSNGTFYPTLLGQLTLPFTTTEEYVGIKANGNFTLNLVYSVGEDVTGLWPTIRQIEDEIASTIETVTEVIDNTTTKQGYNLSVNTAASYTEVRFNEILPEGSLIMGFPSETNVTFYLTDENGNIETSLISTNLKTLLPYKTTKAYRGIKANTATTITFEIAGDYGVDVLRRQILIQTTDSDIDILNKFRYAYYKGNYDVFFEQGVYTLSDVYRYMKRTLGWTWTMGLPVGKGCRYFFNNSTIISNAPSGTYTDDRNILDCKLSATNYEIHDVTLILNGGTYCVHDETKGASEPYSHRYYNVKFINNGGTTCVGVGTGFDSHLSFMNCEYEDGLIAIHAPTSNPNDDRVAINLLIDSCYYSNGKIPFTINPDQLDLSRDNVTVRISNTRFDTAIPPATIAIINTLKAFNNSSE